MILTLTGRNPHASEHMGNSICAYWIPLINTRIFQGTFSVQNVEWRTLCSLLHTDTQSCWFLGVGWLVSGKEVREPMLRECLIYILSKPCLSGHLNVSVFAASCQLRYGYFVLKSLISAFIPWATQVINSQWLVPWIKLCEKEGARLHNSGVLLVSFSRARRGKVSKRSSNLKKRWPQFFSCIFTFLKN